MNIDKIILKPGSFPILNQEAVVKDAIDIMNQYKLGSVCVVNKSNKLIGIITDGDLRRKLVKFQKPFPEFMNNEIKFLCSKRPISISRNITKKKVLKIMNSKKIWDLPVVDSKKKLIGIIHLQDLLKVIIK